MKTSILIAAIVACALSAPIVSAQEKPAPAEPAMNMDMGKPAREGPAPAKSAMNMDMDKNMSQMPEKMKAMQAQMDRIRNTTDPEERQKLMQEHMQTMQENMKAMRGMGGPMMMDAPKDRGMMGGKKGRMKDRDMMKRHAMMEKRIDMMQMMMEQMMQRDQAMESMPHK